MQGKHPAHCTIVLTLQFTPLNYLPDPEVLNICGGECRAYYEYLRDPGNPFWCCWATVRFKSLKMRYFSDCSAEITWNCGAWRMLKLYSDVQGGPHDDKDQVRVCHMPGQYLTPCTISLVPSIKCTFNLVVGLGTQSGYSGAILGSVLINASWQCSGPYVVMGIKVWFWLKLQTSSIPLLHSLHKYYVFVFVFWTTPGDAQW